MTVTNSEIGAFTTAQSDIGTPASGDELLIYDVSATATKKVQASALAGLAGGAVASDAIWDAKGDLAAGTGANTAAKLTAGSNGMVPVYDSGQSNGLKTAYPPGYEFDYVQITADATITSTTTGDTVITGNSVSYDGSTDIYVEFYCASANADTGAAGRILNVILYDGASQLGYLALLATPAAAADRSQILARRRLTPSNASHQYIIKATVSAGSGFIRANNDTSGNYMPAYLRVIKA